MIPGARILKTGIAVSITMFICRVLQLEPALFGAVSAVVNLQPSIRLTFESAREQIIVHVLGVLIAFGVGFTVGASPITMGLVVVIIIWLYSRLKLHRGVLMGIVAAIFVMSSASEQFVSHAVSRTGVIFIGLLVASVVNVLLFRPRYREQLVEKLKTASSEITGLFVTAIKAFCATDNVDFEMIGRKLESSLVLLDDCHKLANLYIHEEFPFGNLADESESQRIIKFIRYNKEIGEKTRDVCDVVKIRNKRRMEHGNPPLSTDFQVILDMLLSSCETIEMVNEKLRLSVCDGIVATPEPVTESFWEQLKGVVEQWQNQNNGSYYLHALLDVSVVAANIRWVARQGKELLNVK